MTGDPHESRSDWLQRARLEFRSNTIIFHDETFVKMVTVEDILNRLSEERQRCYWAHSDAEMQQQEKIPVMIFNWNGKRAVEQRIEKEKKGGRNVSH